MADKGALSRRRREPRSDDEVAAGIARQIRALGRRAATADPDSARLLQMLQHELDQAFADEVAGWRHCFSDATIGRELGVTRQAVRQRWPRQTNPQ